MSDTINNPAPAEAKLPYELTQDEKDWIYKDADGSYSDLRSRGLDVMHRIELGLPISPRELAVAKFTNEDPGWADYRKRGTSEDHIAKLMAERVGSFLTGPSPKDQTADFPTDMDLTGLIDNSAYEMWHLSDERPPDPQVNQQQPTEGVI